MKPLFRTPIRTKKFLSSFRNPRGVSLIIAIIFTTFIMMISIDLAKTIRITIENIRRSQVSSQTYYLGKTLEDMVAFTLRHPEVFKGKDIKAWIEGKIKDMAEKTLCIKMNGEVRDPCNLGLDMHYEILREAKNPLFISNIPNTPPDGKLYVLPSPEFHREFKTNNGESVIFGTGSAGTNCRSDKEESQIDNPTNPTGKPGLQNGDHSCHWNKLFFGDFVEIPLYSEDKQGNIVNPKNRDSEGRTLETLILRVRTPCKDSGISNCASDQRVALYPQWNDLSGAVRDIGKDKTMVHWQIIGKDKKTNETITLWALGENDGNKRIQDPKFNTEIYASKINNNADFNNFIVLNPDTWGIDVKDNKGPLIKFINNKIKEPPWDNQDLHKPILRLELISIPRNADIQNWVRGRPDFEYQRIPYLEYQILTNRPISDFKTWIRGYVEVNGIKKSFETVLEKPKTLGRGFVLDQF